ncbi:MAG: agmatine deiminase family protein [Dysgonamonadaceae bacterium]|jgi:agmatine/peptidylarginine deiminase|nr:agmatine deiminase family protein [Dysgonamonadaceae bacterium]
MKSVQHQITLPAEWTPQSGVQLTWPHLNTDWRDILDEVIPCYCCIAKEIVKREKLLVVCQDIAAVSQQLFADPEIASFTDRIIFREIPSNDTWARDHGAIAIRVNGNPYLYDFTFNGWGLKFAANHDNQITKRLYEQKTFLPEVGYQGMKYCVLEGGSIESNGAGTILTTSRCLLSPNRNDYKLKAEIHEHLQMIFDADKILWLNHGYLAGDDTDSHIDTLARFCDEQTIAYVQCNDSQDEHAEELQKMEQELQAFRQPNGQPYTLKPLPMADVVMDSGNRLPATYANFLIINEAILFPCYDSPKDEIAQKVLQQLFPDREIVGINCLPLIKQHGSLHCVTMQFPEGFI